MSGKCEFVSAPDLSEKKQCAKCACGPRLGDRCFEERETSCMGGYLIARKEEGKK